MAEMMKDAVLGSLWYWCQWLAGLLFNLTGWPGLIAVAAGCLLLLSLSARAVKFFNTPRGMATTAAVLAVSLAWVWWWWPKVALATPSRELANYEPDARRSSGPVPKLKAVVPPPVEAMEVPPLASQQPEPSPPPVVPPLVLELPTPAPAPAISLPPSFIPPVKPVTPPHGKHHVAVKPPQTNFAKRQATLNAQRQAVQRARAMAQHNAMIDRQFNMMMQHLGSGMGHMGGTGHAGGMGHMGGMHGGMGHTGGHH